MANSWIPHTPSIKQTIFLAYEGTEAMYGGAAGGGKSDALLMAALQWADHVGYVAMLLRRTYADLALPGALMDRANEWLRPTKARWSGAERTWKFPSGATLSFGHLDNANDHYRYQGAEFHFIGFDELTQFEEHQYLYLFSRLRKLEGSPIPLRMRAASNPGGVGHGWVKSRFLEPHTEDRIFVPARLEDNKALNQVEYRKSLEKLDPFTRAQLLEGDWTEYSGGLFRREWFEVVDAEPVPLRKCRYWDLAATEKKPGEDPDWTVGVLMGKSRDGIYYVLDVQRTRSTPAGVQALVKQTAEIDSIHVPVWIEQEPGSSGVNVIDHYQRNVLAGWNFSGDRVTGDKATRAAPLSSQAQAGNVKLLRGEWNRAFLEELGIFPHGQHDDQVDAASGSFGKIALGAAWRKLEVY